jgi:hypothetical protein
MGTTRSDLHRLSAHVLARRRYDVTGHFGLRASPGGLGTPAFGPEPETLRLDGTALVREVGTSVSSAWVNGATLRELAAFAGVDLHAGFSAGAATPPVGPVDEPLELDAAELAVLFEWFDRGWRVLDDLLCERGAAAAPATVQLWPEHFDVGTSVALQSGARVNLGFSPGDAFSDEPYLYVGPQGPERPGDGGYWNAPFGAFRVRSSAGGAAGAAEFIREGLARLEKVDR